MLFTVAPQLNLGLSIIERPSAQMYCNKKKCLLDEFTAAVSVYLRLESAQIAAVVRGEDAPFAAELDAARKRKEVAKQAIREHQERHGC